MSDRPDFPNGFTNWYETFFLVTEYIVEGRDRPLHISPVVEKIQHDKGTGGLWELAHDLTFEFEKENEGRDWDGDYFDTISEFLQTKLYPDEKRRD